MFSGVLRNEKDIDHDTTEAFVDQVRAPGLELDKAVLLYSASCARACLRHASLVTRRASLQAKMGYSARARPILAESMLQHLKPMQRSPCASLPRSCFAVSTAPY